MVRGVPANTRSEAGDRRSVPERPVARHRFGARRERCLAHPLPGQPLRRRHPEFRSEGASQRTGIRETATDGDIFEAARSRDEELLRPGKPHALKPFSPRLPPVRARI
ncbi:hypothetical protein CHELA40_30207 [Chelatococcus asaccharovorans]|nr:hypothetical protein CHELA17_40208 [Chelatococcus asaccharovorans]CAH1688342.1 hypothetical protein CHELA40_30207 [Chelatococcus asaccharovorans]